MPQVTDALSKDVHSQLVSQLDIFAANPWGFLGLDGAQFRLAIGYTEAACAVCCLIPGKLRKIALHILLIVLACATGTHVWHADGKWQPATILALQAVFQLYGERKAARSKKD